MKACDIRPGVWVREYGRWVQVVTVRRKTERTEYLDREGWTADVVTLTVRRENGGVWFPQYPADDEVDVRADGAT